MPDELGRAAPRQRRRRRQVVVFACVTVWHARCFTGVAKQSPEAVGLGRNGLRGCESNAPRGAAMAMDVWYELMIREMSDVNEAAHELMRDAESAREASDQDEEE
jgi:hypothetical protein